MQILIISIHWWLLCSVHQVRYFRALYLLVTNVDSNISKAFRSTAILAISYLFFLCLRNTYNFTSMECPIPAFKSHCKGRHCKSFVDLEVVRPKTFHKNAEESLSFYKKWFRKVFTCYFCKIFWKSYSILPDLLKL